MDSRELEETFSNYSATVQNLQRRPANDELLNLYGLFKQATEGDVTEERPGGFDFKAFAKYDAWNSLKGKSKEEAMTAYIELAKNLIAKYS